MQYGLPKDIGALHFIGIGGIGMSGIAEVMKTLGYEVQGSDLSDNYNVARLKKMGVTVKIGHSADNIGDASIAARFIRDRFAFRIGLVAIKLGIGHARLEQNERWNEEQ